MVVKKEKEKPVRFRLDLAMFLFLVGLAILMATMFYFMPKENYAETLRGTCDFVNSSVQHCEFTAKDVRLPVWGFR